MTEATWSPDDEASGESSHEADVKAGFDSEDQESAPGASVLGAPDNAGVTDNADGAEGNDSHAADVDAGYDDADTATADDTDVTPATGIG